MKQFSLIFLSIIISCVFSDRLSSQDKDAGLWTGIEIEKSLNNIFTLEFSTELRMNNNISSIEKGLAEIGLGAELGKYLDAVLYYRYTRQFVPEFGWVSKHRIYSDLRFKYSWDEFTFSERARFSMEKSSVQQEEIMESDLRFKTMLRYNIRKTPLKVFLAMEFFFPVSQYQDIYAAEKNRFTAGLRYVVNPSLSCDLTFRYQQVSYRQRPQQNYIYGVKLNYKL